MTGRRDVCSSHKPENSPEGSILFPPTIDKMIPSKLQFDHSREFRQKLNQYEKKKEEEKTKRVHLLR